MTLTRVGKEGCSRLLSRWEIMRKSMIHTHTYVSDPNNICRALLAFFMIVSYCKLTVGHVSPDYPVPSAHLIRRSAPRLNLAIDTITDRKLGFLGAECPRICSSNLPYTWTLLSCDILPLLRQFSLPIDAFWKSKRCYSLSLILPIWNKSDGYEDG